MWITSRYEFDRRRKHLSGIAVGLIVAVIVILAAGTAWLLIQRAHRSPLPAAIAKQVDFVVLYPTDPWTVSPQAVTYNSQSKTLGINAMSGTAKLTVTQQAAPSQFTDVPQYYPALIEKLGEYRSFGTVNGTVYLTHPRELGGGTEGVLNHNGTLLFAFPSKHLSDAQWRDFFNNLRSLK